MTNRFAHYAWKMMPVFVLACGPAEDPGVDGRQEEEEGMLCPAEGCNGDAATVFGRDSASNTANGAVTINLGSSMTDEINQNGDIDWFKFYQDANTLTRVLVTGADCSVWFKSGTTYVRLSSNDLRPAPGECFINFVPSSARWWYIKVERFDGSYGPELVTTGAQKPCTQPHSELDEGGPMGGVSCNACIGTVCDSDSYCCNSWWDSMCVAEAHAWCGI